MRGDCIRINKIPDYPNYYVSDNGNVFKKIGNELLPYNGWVDKHGYHYVKLKNEEGTKNKSVHRLVAYAFCKNYFDGAVVDHIDADTHNNNYDNLEWVTTRENIHRSYATSGVNQLRNYCIYYIEYPDGGISEDLKSGTSVKEYIVKHGLPIKASMLLKHRIVNGYKLHKRDYK